MRSASAMSVPATVDSGDQTAAPASHRPQPVIASGAPADQVVIDDISPYGSSGDLTSQDRDVRLLDALLAVLDARQSTPAAAEIQSGLVGWVSDELEWC